MTALIMTLLGRRTHILKGRFEAPGGGAHRPPSLLVEKR
jgi:hypothetical protein